MEFAEKYTVDETDIKKILVSKDAYAIGEMIENLIKKIEEVKLFFLFRR